MKTIHLYRRIRNRFSPLLLRTAALTCLTLIAACQQPAIEEPVGASGLAEVKHAGIDSAQIDPTVDLRQYRSLLIDGLRFSDTQIVDPNRSHSARYKDFVLSDADKQRLNELFMQQMSRQLTRDGVYTVATQPAANTLRVETELVRLEPNAPRESDERFTSSARNDTYTRGAGSLTLESTIYDSVSGKRVAVLRDEYTDTEIWGNNNVVTNTAAIQRAFSRWASTLQRQLQVTQPAK